MMRIAKTVAFAAPAPLFAAVATPLPALAGPAETLKPAHTHKAGRNDSNKSAQGLFGATATLNAAPAAKPTGRSPYDALIARQAAAHGVPLALAHAVIRHESNYRPDVRGRAGEVGLMQIKPSTARGLGYSGSTKGLYDPETNLRWGMKYLGEAHRLGRGDICGTILRYNAGHAARRMNPRSSAYCASVKRHMASNKAP